jgi:hypothetical protein
MTTIAPLCAGRCGRQMDSPPDQDPWLAVLSRRGPLKAHTPRATYFVCSQCETEVTPRLLARLRDGEVVPLPDNTPATVFALIRGELTRADS